MSPIGCGATYGRSAGLQFKCVSAAAAGAESVSHRCLSGGRVYWPTCNVVTWQRRLRSGYRVLAMGVKSPKVYIRDPGLAHALLGVPDYSALGPARAFLVTSASDRYVVAEGVEAIGLVEMMITLSAP